MLTKMWLALFVLGLIPLTGLSQEQPKSTQSQHSPAIINVDLAHPGAAISPQMFGIFFEDINFAADGGLYPELVKNRSFEFSEPLMGWHEDMELSSKGLGASKGELSVRTENPLNETNPHYLRVRVYEPGYGFRNTGFRGMGIKSGAEYRLSAYVRSSGPKVIRASVLDKAARRSPAASSKVSMADGSAMKR